MNFRIKKGNHYASGLNFCPHFGRRMSIGVRFAPTAHYKPRLKDGKPDPGDLGVSKVAGFSGFIPGRTSVRIGWRCTPSPPAGNVEIWAYYHIAGIHSEKLLCLARCGDLMAVELVDTGDSYQVTVRKTSAPGITASIPKPWTAPFGWTHYPYFGGTNTAPQDIDVDIRW